MRARIPSLALCFFAGLLAFDAHAQVGIGQGRESDILNLLLPYRDEGPVGDGVVIASIAIARDKVHITLRAQDATTASVDLVPNSEPDAAKSFQIHSLPTQSPRLLAAQQRLAQAVARNDSGKFFDKRAQVSVEPSQNPLKLNTLLGFTALLWLVLLISLIGHFSRGPRPVRQIVELTAVVVVGVFARRGVPFSPLHANGHAFEDLALGLSVPGTETIAIRNLSEYGPGWLSWQRWTVGLGDVSHDGMARWSIAVGATAMAFAYLAARRMYGRFWAIFAFALVGLAPVALRVGHSESVFVVAQLLIATALFLGTAAQSALDRFGVFCALMLLSLGHPLGAGFATGAALIVFGSQSFDSSAQSPQRLANLRWLGALATAVLVGLALQLSGSGGLLASRATVADQIVPIPLQFWQFSLWCDAAWASTLVVPLALLGCFVFADASTPNSLWQARLARSAKLTGFACLFATGLLVTACVSDGLRYQAPLAPALMLLIGNCSNFSAQFGQQLGLRFLAVLVLIGGFADALRPRPAGQVMDAQGQSYHQLRQWLQTQSGDVWLLVPNRDGARRSVVVEAPVGRLSENGPTIHALRAGDAQTACATHLQLPANTRIFWDAPCSAVEMPQLPSPCSQLQPFIDPSRAPLSAAVKLQQARLPEGMSGEFHHYTQANPKIFLSYMHCPP